MVITRDRHGRPWGFFGPPVPVPKKNRTRTLGHGKFMSMGMVFSRVPVFLGAFWVTGFQVTLASGYDKKNTMQYVFLILAICNKKKTSNTRLSNVPTQSVCMDSHYAWCCERCHQAAWCHDRGHHATSSVMVTIVAPCGVAVMVVVITSDWTTKEKVSMAQTTTLLPPTKMWAAPTSSAACSPRKGPGLPARSGSAQTWIV